MHQGATLIVPPAAYEELPGGLQSAAPVLANGEVKDILGLAVSAVPMYNLPEQNLERIFHEPGRGNGYVLVRDNYRVYIAGDTADIPEMRALTDIDLAFVPMNLPYTMDINRAADAVLAFAPRVVYPYHYRGTEGLSDVDAFRQIVEAQKLNIEVRLVPWYK